MSKKHASDNFSDYQFLELYIALLKKENKNLVISTNELETTLVSFYNNDEYKPLFYGLDMVNEANLEYVDLGRAFLVAFTWGLLNLVEDATFEIKYNINITDKEADDILSMHTEENVKLMKKLVSEITFNKDLLDEYCADVLFPEFNSNESRKRK